ncbi:MAG: DUF433 domain-containing protein [Sphaerospermopsis sp. SIO1G2]|nr:DUF433 domain-containing protein [Sphaerospermopsis sp. SIO1G2]
MNEITTKEASVIRTSRGLTVAGTRITLYTILDYLKNQWPPHLIQDWFNLSDQQLQGVLAYIELNRDEVEAEYQQVLADAKEIKRYWEEQNRERFAKIATLPPPLGKEEAWAKLQKKKMRLSVT